MTIAKGRQRNAGYVAGGTNPPVENEKSALKDAREGF